MFQLNTPRLILRDFIEADWHAMHPIFSDVETTQYIAWIKSETEIDTRDRIKDIIYHNQLQPRTVYNLVIVRQADQEVLGWIGIGEASDPTIGDLNFGYALRKTDWGQGHMTEALRALLDFCFVELGVKKIFGECDVANTGSARVMEKAGMSLEARLTEQDKDTGKIDESLRYSLLYHTWLDQQTEKNKKEDYPMNPIIQRKRAELARYIERHVVSESTVQGVVAVGSVATGLARADSDIDAIIFLDPLDLYAVPAEFYWQPEADTFHGIFSAVENVIQLDFKRLDLQEWSQPNYVWPEPICAELSEGWLAFDRTGQIQPLLAERTHLTAALRQARLDEALIQLDQLLEAGKAAHNWINLGASMAHDRLHAAYDFLVTALFTYNHRWRPWRSREMAYLFKLPWLPENFEAQALLATNALSPTQDGYEQRVTVLQRFFAELIVQCQQEGLYGPKAIDEAFIRTYEEPGRDWNMAEWVQKHQQRQNDRRETR